MWSTTNKDKGHIPKEITLADFLSGKPPPCPNKVQRDGRPREQSSPWPLTRTDGTNSLWLAFKTSCTLTSGHLTSTHLLPLSLCEAQCLFWTIHHPTIRHALCNRTFLWVASELFCSSCFSRFYGTANSDISEDECWAATGDKGVLGGPCLMLLHSAHCDVVFSLTLHSSYLSVLLYATYVFFPPLSSCFVAVNDFSPAVLVVQWKWPTASHLLSHFSI